MDNKLGKLGDVRRASGITIEDAAGICGMSVPTFRARENNPEKFTVGDLAALYAHLNSSGRYLVKATMQELFF